MEANARLDIGALEVELRAENSEKLESELSRILEFLDANEDNIKNLTQANKLPVDDSSDHGVKSSKHEGSIDSASANPLGRVAKRLRINKDALNSVILIDEEYPTLFLDDEKILGDHKSERQRKASLILLYLWDECYSEDRVKTTRLKDALSMSGISDSNLANMYQGKGDRFFDRTGRGASATIGLTTPGERRAQKVIADLVTELENNGSLDNFDRTKTEDFL